MSNKQRTVQANFVAIGLVGSIVVLVCLIVYFLIQVDNQQNTRRSFQINFKQLVSTIYNAKINSYFQVVKDNSAWDELYESIYKDPIDSEWIDINVAYMVDTYKATGISFYDSLGVLKYSSLAEDIDEKDIFGPEEDVLKHFENSPFCNYYIRCGNRIFEVFGSTIVGADDIAKHETSPKGFTLFSKELDIDFIDNLEQSLTDTKVYLNISSVTDSLMGIQVEENMIATSKSLLSYDGTNCGFLIFKTIDSLYLQNKKSIPLFAIISFILFSIFAIVYFTVKKSVIRPLDKIVNSLENNNLEPIQSLRQINNEFTQISNLIQLFFEQKINIEESNVELLSQKEEILSINESLVNHQNKLELAYQEQKKLVDELYDKNSILKAQSKQLEDDKLEMTRLFDTISHANEEVERANRQVQDSINYAKRIQKAMLGSVAPTKDIFEDYFLIFHPKDVVGGDFYYCRKVDKYLIACLGDCTGHGVPGAMLATMGISLLNQIIDNMPIISPAEVLNRLRTSVIKNLSGVGEEKISHAEGMDVGLFVLDTTDLSAVYAGAGRPLFYVRGEESFEVKGDKMPIGRFVKTDNFTNHNLQMQKGDIVYLYSDGCTDQAGGSKGRKILSATLREIVFQGSALPLDIQGHMIDEFINQWRGERPRTDDTSMFAFKI